MSIDWSDEAIDAAFDEAMECFDDAMMENHQDQIRAAMRRALDAAVKAQGCILLDRDDEAHHERSYNALDIACVTYGEPPK